MRTLRIILVLCAPIAIVLAIATRAHADTLPTVTVEDASVVEGGKLLFAVRLNGTASSAVQVSYGTAAGTAGSSDVTAFPVGTLTFPAGVSNVGTKVEVQTVADDSPETHETVRFALANPVNATLGSPSSATGTIKNDDLTLTAASLFRAEGSTAGGITNFALNPVLHGAFDSTVYFRVHTVDGTATSVGTRERPADYVPFDDIRSIPPHTSLDTTASVSIGVHQDQIPENSESFQVQLTDVSVALRAGSALSPTMVIINDDAAALRVNDGEVYEGDAGGAVAHVTVSAVPTPEYDVSFTWRTRETGSATAATDFTAVTTRTNTALASQSGQISLSIPIAGDIQQEPTETFQVEIIGVSTPGVTLGDDTGVVTIRDDDTPTITFEGGGTYDEGADAGVIIHLSKTVAHEVRVPWHTVDGSASCLGLHHDYDCHSGVEVFEAGATYLQRVVSTKLLTDSVIEGTETMSIEPNGAPTGGAFASGQARQFHIRDDDLVSGDPGFKVNAWTDFFDQAPTCSDARRRAANFARTSEGNSGVKTIGINFDLWNSAGTERRSAAKAIEIHPSTSDESATAADNDYSPFTGLVFIEPGQSTVHTDMVTVKGDTKAFEPDESFIVHFSEYGTGNCDANNLRIWILDDDPEASGGF